MRTFIDSRGTLWEVSEFLAQHGDVRALRFVSGAEVREFGGVPPEWEHLPDKELESICRRAVVTER